MENYVIENQEENRFVTLLQFTAQDKTSIITGLLAVFETVARARKVMHAQAMELKEEGYMITRLNRDEIKLVNPAEQERILYLETYKVM